MRRILTLVLAIAFTACSPKIIPIQGDYPQTPIVYKSDKSFTEVWDKLVDLFAQKGLSIKLIDKSSGLIVSDNSTIIVTCEDKDMKPINKDAHMVVAKYYNSNVRSFLPITKPIPGAYSSKSKKIQIATDYVRGEWNVRVKSVEGGTTINVNLVNVQYDFNEGKVIQRKNLSIYKTTGVFERMIAEFIR